MTATLTFGEFALDLDTRRLLRQGADVHLSPKAFELLTALVENHPRAVSKNELRERLWPGVFVSEGNLALLMTEVRNALGDDAREPRFVRTLHGFGYAFKADVTEGTTASRSAARSEAAHWLLWATRSLRLQAGESVIGRQPGCDVLLDVPGVSRRHARLTIGPHGASIDDLGSKNGTLVNGRSITARVDISDRVEIQIGPVILTYREVVAVDGNDTFTMPSGPPASSRGS